MNKNNKNITEILLYYDKLVHFQSDMMEHLYDERSELYRLVSSFFSCTQVIVLICDEKGTVQSDMYDVSKEVHIEKYQILDANLENVLQCGRQINVSKKAIPESVRKYLTRWGIFQLEYLTLFGGKVNNALYTVILCHSVQNEIIKGMEGMLVNNIKMCLENRIFHEIVTYESQHDMLTKLYNRRYYFKRCKEEYPLVASIGLFYFDVNNLKIVNDNYGHDAGDVLLQKAAESIRCLTSDTVHGYRMGGDEFIVVAVNCTRSDMEAIKARWEAELKRVNEKYGGFPCIIAVGSAFAKGSFEIEELCKIADKRMYQDKINKKARIGK